MIQKRGFTLIELLVAISIIAVLTAVLLPNFMNVREKARDSQRIQDMTTIKNALRMYYNDAVPQSYPAVQGTLDADLLPYLPDVVAVLTSLSAANLEYTQKNSGDGFVITVELSAKTGDEWKQSMLKCGFDQVTDIDPIISTPALPAKFAVCAN